MRSLPTTVALLGVLATTALACEEQAPTRVWRPEDHAHPAGNVPPSQMVAPAPSEAPEGTARERALAALYGVHCASCHGPEGRGDGPARAPAMQMPDFTSAEWQSSRDDEALTSAIAQGRNMMPGFGDRIAVENIFGLVEHVRGFAAQAPEAMQRAEGAVAAPEGAGAP